MPDRSLYVVTIIAQHRRAKHAKRWTTVQVWAYSWTDAAVSQECLDAEARLVPTNDLEDWTLEVRVYLANGDGAAEGLPVGREDGGMCQ